jgi:MFS family permease
LIPVINIVTNAMTAAVYIPMAKLLDVWGRAEGFISAVACSTLGVVLMAVSNNLATFCAARVCWNGAYTGNVQH